MFQAYVKLTEYPLDRAGTMVGEAPATPREDARSDEARTADPNSPDCAREAGALALTCELAATTDPDADAAVGAAAVPLLTGTTAADVDATGRLAIPEGKLAGKIPG